MKSVFLLSCCLTLALVCVAAADVEMESTEVEWIEPSFVESVSEATPAPRATWVNPAALPAAGKPCGAGLRGVCSSRAAWCGAKVAVPGQCASSGFCCTPRAAPAAIPNRPTPTTTAASSTLNRGADVAGPVVVTANTGSYTGSLPIGDLSPLEASVDGGREESPLSNTQAASIAALDARVKAVPSATAPRIAYDTKTLLNMDNRLSLNGAPVPRVMGVAGSTGTLPTVGAVPSNGLCGAYAGQTVTKMSGNKGVVYEVVKVLRQHAEDPSMLTASPSARDNTMRTATACAFDKMHEAAKKAGVTILIASAFRTHARQQYFWDCFQKKNCNGGRRAARPGNSNHGVGIALDLNQSGPAGKGLVYKWLAANAQSYGFVRTVPDEKWHWEYRPGTPKARYT